MNQHTKLFHLVKRFFSLSSRQRWLVVQTLLLILLLRASLQFFSLQTLLLWLKKSKNHRMPDPPCQIQEIQYAISAVGRRLPFATCLTNGLAGQYLLGRNGYSSTLHIGVKKESATLLAAHAWVTIDQQVVIGMIDDLHTYTTLPQIG